MNEDTGTHLHLQSPHNRGNISLSIEPGQKLISLLLALSILGNVAMFFTYRYAIQETDLKRYDLDFFKQNDWVALKAQVDTQGKLIDSYGIQRAVIDAQSQEKKR